jgi:hypothetical protein
LIFHDAVAAGSQEAEMAQKVTVELQDDLDGGPADETVRFGSTALSMRST